MVHVSQLVQDLRFAARSLRRRRAFTSIAIATVALGIGAATSIYTVVDGVLLRPLPYRDAGRLVAIWQTYPSWKKEPILAAMWDRIPLSIPEYRDVRKLTSVFENVAVWAGGASTITDVETPELVSTVRASASLLAVLGVRPLLGRMFLPSEDVPGGPRVLLVTYESWQARFAGDRHILGRTVRLDDEPYTVIGVLPRGMTVGRQEASLLGQSVFWIPVGQDSNDYHERTNHSYRAVARLAPGASIERARLETSRLLSDAAPTRAKGVRLDEWQSDQVRDAKAPLLILLGAVALLLGIACVNTATLALGEAATRDQEMATRLAIGANRFALVRQLLTESLVLALSGSVIGVLLAAAGTTTLVALAPPKTPGLADVHVDLRVLGAALVVATATGLLFGLAPALVSAGTGPASVLRVGTGQSARGRGALQRGLVALELALSVVLLVGAGLLTRSLDKITSVNPGFRTDHLLVVRTSLPAPLARDSARVVRFYDGLTARIPSVPGVVAMTLASQPPFNGGSSSTTVQREGAAASAGPEATRAGREAQQRMVVPGFFATLGIPLLAGREFTADDRAGAPNVVIVSDALARRDFPGESPLGQRVKFQGQWRTIVGVVGDVHYQKLSRDVEATIYAPPAQRGSWSLQVLIRSAAEPTALARSVRAVIHDVEPRATVISENDMRELIRRSSVEERYRTLLISLFGVLAVLLASIGIYGVTARAVARRTREVGIRLALGATSAGVVRLLVWHTLTGVIGGLVLGLLGGVFAGKLLSPFLFGVEATDPTTYGAMVGLLTFVSVLASWLPARRAGRLEVAGVLRGE